MCRSASFLRKFNVLPDTCCDSFGASAGVISLASESSGTLLIVVASSGKLRVGVCTQLHKAFRIGQMLTVSTCACDDLVDTVNTVG